MNKLVKIFLKFIKLMKENGRDFKKARLELVKEGFLLTEIEAALEWYFGESHLSGSGDSGRVPLCEPSDKSFRYFTLSEQRLLSYETRGYLTELLVSGVVSHEEIESVIETLNEYMIEEATIEDVDSIMIGLRTLDISNHDGAEDSVEFKVRYIQ